MNHDTTQMDFVASAMKEPTLTQSSFLDDNGKVNLKSDPTFHEVDKFFNALDRSAIERHTSYWEKLKPTTVVGKFRRWIFAFCSVHTSWQSNVKGYNALKDYDKWVTNDKELMRRLKKCGVGLYNNRQRFLSKFSKQFFDNPDFFEKKKDESWVEFRNRLVPEILGLQKAKTSFALELLDPLKAQVFCADVHLFRFYGLDQSKDYGKYEQIESHWLNMCRMWNVPPYIARAIRWNQIQDKPVCDYWAWCLKSVN